MAHAEKCPICLGKGKIACTGKETVIPWIEQPNCYGCGGKGWVEIGKSDSIWTQNDLHTDYLPIQTSEPKVDPTKV